MRADEQAERERVLLDSSERRIARLAFDLHDGPLQTVAALAADVRHFRAHLGGVVLDHHRQRVLGCVDDLEARLVALDEELRELLHDQGSSLTASRPFVDILREEVAAHDLHVAAPTELVLEGEFGNLTGSQGIVLVRFVQEALANVRAHSGAETVEVSVRGHDGYVEASVVDDGRGFEVEPTLARATKDRRFGLIGMRERARFIGGDLSLDSRKGGPTALSLVVPGVRPRSGHAQLAKGNYLRPGNF